MSIQKALEKLGYNNEGVFPREALIEVINNRDEAIPHLLGILEYSIENIDRLIMDDGYFAHIYAMYLLAQFKEQKAYPLFIKLFSIPGEIVLDFTGEVVTEDLGKILCSVCNGDIEPIKSLIENRTANDYVRSAAFECLVILVATGQKTCSEIMAYFKELFNGKLEREHSHVWDALVINSYYLYPEEVFDDIKRAYDEGLVDSFFIGFESIMNAMENGRVETLQRIQPLMRNKCRPIEDTVKEMEGWVCFEQPENKKSSNSAKKSGYKKKDNKTGRNDPCLCGSGKKYKKCCLGKGE